MKKNICAAIVIMGSAMATNAVAGENPAHIGVGSYNLSITDHITTDTFAGGAVLAGYDISDFVTIDTHLYALKHVDFSYKEMNGYDLLLRLGKSGAGLNLAFTAGLWTETMSAPSVNSVTYDYSGTSLGLSAGYSWDSLSLLLEGSRRTVKDYQGTSTADINAATGAFNIAYRF